MIKLIIALFIPAFLFGKFQVTTYFPLETYLVKYIGKNEIRVKQINNRFISKKRKIANIDLSKLAEVKLYIHLGLNEEKEYESIFKTFNPYIKVLNLSKDINLLENNPYYWLDPFNLRTVSKNIYEEFCLVDKENCNFYKNNYLTFLKEIDNVFLRVKEKIYSSEVQNIYVLDDYWDYFANRFRLNLIKKQKNYVKLDEISNLIKFTNKKNVTSIINLKGDSMEIAKSIASNANIKLIEHDPFEEQIFINLKSLTQKITNKKEEK